MKKLMAIIAGGAMVAGIIYLNETFRGTPELSWGLIPEAPLEVETEVPERRTIIHTITAPGTIEPVVEVDDEDGRCLGVGSNCVADVGEDVGGSVGDRDDLDAGVGLPKLVDQAVALEGPVADGDAERERAACGGHHAPQRLQLGVRIACVAERNKLGA